MLFKAEMVRFEKDRILKNKYIAHVSINRIINYKGMESKN
jgi:hypothetical protein